MSDEAEITAEDTPEEVEEHKAELIIKPEVAAATKPANTKHKKRRWVNN